VSEPITTDVLIAGGGPCGLMLAHELGRHGIRCLLIDSKPSTAFNPPITRATLLT
jgi:2-polyprenyl-6-methoxyphenol hydroxylase-like FAD-dependent oxidoreductase